MLIKYIAKNGFMNFFFKLLIPLCWFLFLDTLKSMEKYRTELTDDIFSSATYDYLRHSKARYTTIQKKLDQGEEANGEETYWNSPIAIC